MDSAVFLTWPIFIFWDHIYVLSAAIWDDCVWLEVVGWRGGCQEELLALPFPASGVASEGSSWAEGAEGGCDLPFVIRMSCVWDQRSEEKIRAIALHLWFFTPEWRRKMWSVSAVIWLCNATDCSGSGKVTYLLGWHDWPMSADVWTQASFWSAAAQLCPWAVLVPVQNNGDFYLPISAYFLYPENFPICLSKTCLVHSVTIDIQIHDFFGFSWKRNNLKESIHHRFTRIK